MAAHWGTGGVSPLSPVPLLRWGGRFALPCRPYLEEVTPTPMTKGNLNLTPANIKRRITLARCHRETDLDAIRFHLHRLFAYSGGVRSSVCS
jgi:hypothetical protein